MNVLRQLGRLIGRQPVEELADDRLLEQFVSRKDPAAFEAIVERYGPLVMGVCRRVLGEEHDAEDAFQATFFVFARKAGSIRSQGAVGSWLCGTAYRIAMKARASASRRREQEKQAGAMPKPDAQAEAAWEELRPVIDEELSRLPEKYRAPLVLCYLEGKTNEAAARELGWAPGSMSYRLNQAREILRERLLQRGVLLSSVMLAPLLLEKALVPVVGSLVQTTAQSALLFTAGQTLAAGVSANAVSLADAALNAMWLLKVKIAAALVVSVAVLAGGVALLIPDRTPPSEPLSSVPYLSFLFDRDTQRFGIACLFHPDPLRKDKPKLLLRDERGIGNNTRILVDDSYGYVFGREIPLWKYVREDGVLQREVKIGEHRWQSIMEDESSRVRITQTVELVRGEQTRLLDTALVRYQVWNRDTRPRKVGLRAMLDTYIGANDGVPFLVPPTENKPAYLLDTMKVFEGAEIPDFIRALENVDPADRNAVVAEMRLKVQDMGPRLKDVEPLEKLVICRWESSEAGWEWKFRAMNEGTEEKDSCVVLYWAKKQMQPGEKRELAFTYGLGQMRQQGTDGPLRLLTAGSSTAGKTFTATAYVKTWQGGEKVSLKLPAGLELVPGQPVEQSVPAAVQGYTQVSWRILSKKPGKYTLKVEASNGTMTEQEVQINASSIFD